MASPTKAPQMLTDMFRRYARTIMGKGGVVRSIENHGLRTLPERAKRQVIMYHADFSVKILTE